MRLKKIILFYWASIAFTGFAQYQENLPQAKPIPPNTAALFKTLERPLGTYTGTIPINFPLCSVTSGSLTANVSLNYTSTGGIRVEELSSCVGLGFNLSAGGVITQIVRDKPDDAYNGMLNITTPYQKPSEFDGYDMEHVNNASLGFMDIEGDSYMYSFNGRSGKFAVMENGDIVLPPNSGIKIEYTRNGYGGSYSDWTITDEAGNKYFYGGPTENQAYYSGSSGSTGDNVISKIYPLNEIADMNGENHITFTYATSANFITTFSGGFYPIFTGPFCGGFNTSFDESTVTSGASEFIVTRIDGNSGSVVFNTATDYLYGPIRVTSLQLYDSSGVYKGRYNFNYGTNFSDDRWRLNNFSQLGSSGTDSLTTSFEYNTSINLPATLSRSKDIWGFYNGAYNPYPWPNFIFTDGISKWIRDDLSSKDANLNAAANILTRINLSTGGYREIEYEGNRVLPYGDFFTVHPHPDYMANRNFTETTYNISSPNMQHLFTINSSYGFTKFYYTLNIGYYGCSDHTLKIMKLTDSTDLSGGTQVLSTGETSGDLILNNGYYRIDVIGGYACNIDDVSGSWQEGLLDTSTINVPYGHISNSSNVLPRHEYPAGGVRVKEIRDFDPVSNKVNKREFKYKLYSTDSTITSGITTSMVNIVGIENPVQCYCTYFRICPTSTYPLASQGGSYVVYPEVRTIDSANGWTDQYFSWDPDVPNSGFPDPPSADLGFARGLLLAEKVYDKNGVLLKKTTNSWYPANTNGQWSHKSKAYFPHPTQTEGFTYTEFRESQSDYPTLSAFADYYPIIGGDPLILQSIDSIFSTTGTQVVKTNYDYYWYNNSYAPVKKMITAINNNRTKEQTYKYAFTSNNEFNLGLTSGEQGMKTTLLGLNYIRPLEVTDTIKTNGGNPSFLSGVKYIFGTFNTNKIHLKQYRAFSAINDSNEINFSAYDYKGNLTEQYKTNDTKEVTLWGYKGHYPVAKVIGSNYATVAAIVSQSILTNPSSDAALRTELNRIRVNLAGTMAQVTTYTYSPLYGMTSMTDANGRTTYYEYDVFGRLKLIRDHDNRIVKKFEYKMNNHE